MLVDNISLDTRITPGFRDIEISQILMSEHRESIEEVHPSENIIRVAHTFSLDGCIHYDQCRKLTKIDTLFVLNPSFYSTLLTLPTFTKALH